MNGDEFNQVQQALSQGWYHWMPFGALFARQAVPENRPMTTRILEQAFVAMIAGGGSAYTVNDVVQARQDERIKAIQAEIFDQNKDLKERIDRSEARLIDQIKELRARQLK